MQVVSSFMTDRYKHTDLISSAVWSTHKGGYESEFLAWICGLKECLQEVSFWFHPRPWAMPVSVPWSLLWPVPVLVRCYEYWACPCARSVAGSVTLLLSEFTKKDFIKEAAPVFYLKPQGYWWTITSLEALGFPPQRTKRPFIWNLSIWLCILASPHVDYMAVGKKVEINIVMRTDIRSCFEDALSNPISDGRIPSLPQLPRQKYLHPISSTTPCFKEYFSSCEYQVTELSDCRAEA